MRQQPRESAAARNGVGRVACATEELIFQARVQARSGGGTVICFWQAEQAIFLTVDSLSSREKKNVSRPIRANSSAVK
jgi:hypothetical protein